MSVCLCVCASVKSLANVCAFFWALFSQATLPPPKGANIISHVMTEFDTLSFYMQYVYEKKNDSKKSKMD